MQSPSTGSERPAVVPATGRTALLDAYSGRLARLSPLIFLLAAASTAWAQSKPATALSTDPVLNRLITESLVARPEIKEGQALVRAQKARATQAGAMPDPMLQVGIQNDGFTSIELGKMETSYISIMASQTFPWPGKLGLRSEIEEITAGRDKKSVERVRLSTEAFVRRTYLELLLVRDRVALLDRLASLWEQAAQVARISYETSGAAQSNILRSQLELSRLKQRRVALFAEERIVVQGLNRLRGHPLDEPIRTTTRLRDMGLPAPITEKRALDDAFARSPELAAARLGQVAAERSNQLADRSYYPDFVVTAGIMPRGGDFPPMWSLSIGAAIPVFAGSNQNQAVEQSAARAVASRANQDALEQLIRLRVRERLTAFSALLESIAVYREQQLVQSEANAQSVLEQFRNGKATFTSVLDAQAGYLADEEGYLQALAQAQRIAIAAFEVSLDPVAVYGAEIMGGSRIPGQVATTVAASTGTTPRDANAERGSSSDPERSMSSM